MKGIQPVKTEWWGAGVVICLERDADLHTAQLMPLPLTVSCFNKIHPPSVMHSDMVYDPEYMTGLYQREAQTL